MAPNIEPRGKLYRAMKAPAPDIGNDDREPASESTAVAGSPAERSVVQAARDEDLCAWLIDQAEKLRVHKPMRIDWMGLAEELEDIVANERAKVISLLAQLQAHLLKWQFSRFRRSEHSWQKTLTNTRTELTITLDESQTLRNGLAAFIVKAYRHAPRMAGQEMRLPEREWQKLFPEQCPYTAEELLNFNFLPELAPTADGRS